MEQRKVGNEKVGAVGLGCMTMASVYGAADDNESIATLRRALELGVNFWDTADIYGSGSNETLIGRVLPEVRDKVFLCTKFGNVYDRSMTNHRDLADGPPGWIVDGTPSYVRKCCERSLERLNTDHIDLYYQHRVDPRTPIEETVGAMAELVKEGKVRYIGLSEAAADTIRRANKVHPITALQTEYSLWTRDVEESILPTTRELGIAFVAYSPLGRGFLTGGLRSPDDIPDNDWRRNHPRFQGDNFFKNLRIVDAVEALGKEKGLTPAQVALAWVLSKGNDVIPIPGTKRIKHLEQNAAAVDVRFSADEMHQLEHIGEAAGFRYPEASAVYLNG